MQTQQEFTPSNIKYSSSKEKLTSYGGLKTIIESFEESPLKAKFTEALPSRVGPRSLGSYRLGLIQVSSFLYGHDCIEDLERFRQDPFLEELMKGETVAPRTMGDFLRDFKDENLLKMNSFLRTQSKAYRLQLKKNA